MLTLTKKNKGQRFQPQKTNIHSIRISLSHFEEKTETKFPVSHIKDNKTIYTKISWNELETQINFLENVLKFERSAIVQSDYDIFLEKMKKSGCSIFSHILENEMKIDNVNSIGVQGKYTLTKNRYPYDFCNHKHFVLWIHPDCDKEFQSTIFSKDKCYEFIKKLSIENEELFGEPERFIIFRNAPINKSVHTIEHFHVLSY